MSAHSCKGNKVTRSCRLAAVLVSWSSGRWPEVTALRPKVLNTGEREINLLLLQDLLCPSRGQNTGCLGPSISKRALWADSESLSSFGFCQWGRLRAGRGGGTPVFPRICLQGIVYAHRLSNWRAPEDTQILHLFQGVSEGRPKPDPPEKSAQGPGPTSRLFGCWRPRVSSFAVAANRASSKHPSAAAVPRRGGRGGDGRQVF